MASTEDFVEYVCEQIQNIGDVRFRKMFGEYMVYVNEKPILMVCDNTVYVKKLQPLEELMKEALLGHPYPGAKEHYILDIENEELAIAVVTLLEQIVPIKLKKQKNV